MADRLIAKFSVGTEEVYRIKWCTTSPDLVALGTSNSLQVIQVNQDYSVKVIKAFRLGARVTEISWGPTSSSEGIPSSILGLDILVACADDNLRLISYQAELDGKPSQSNIKIFGQGHSGHSGRITSIAWCTVPGYANIIASAGSDKCVLIWNLDADENGDSMDPSQQTRPAPTLLGPFKYTPVSISFHSASSGKLMIYDSTGTVKLIDWTKQHRPVILSLIEPRTLINKLHATKLDQDRIGMADWKLDEVDVFGALNGNRWAVWDIKSTRAGTAIATGDAWAPGVVADRFRWCTTNPRLFAISTSSPNASSSGFGAIQVYYTTFPQSPRTIQLPLEISPSRKRVHDIDWQPTKTDSDVLCVAVGRQLVWIQLEVKGD